MNLVVPLFGQLLMGPRVRLNQQVLLHWLVLLLAFDLEGMRTLDQRLNMHLNMDLEPEQRAMELELYNL
jgi:hypothetical protein